MPGSRRSDGRVARGRGPLARLRSPALKTKPRFFLLSLASSFGTRRGQRPKNALGDRRDVLDALVEGALIRHARAPEPGHLADVLKRCRVNLLTRRGRLEV